MNRSPLRRAMSMLVFASALPLFVLGCPKKQPEVVDAGPPPPVVVEAGPTQVGPLDDDGGDDGEAEAAPVKHSGGGGNINTIHLKQCCGALRTQAKALGSSPEANVLLGFASQCDTMATAATSGNAPEFAAFRTLLKGHVVPGCQGL